MEVITMYVRVTVRNADITPLLYFMMKADAFVGWETYNGNFVNFLLRDNFQDSILYS